MTNPYLLFNKECSEALKLYDKAFGIKNVHIQKYGEMPPDPNYPISAEVKDLVLHGMFEINGAVIMCCDTIEAQIPGGPVFISMSFPALEEAQKVWDILAEGGSVRIPLAPQFFSKGHGSLVDKYGIGWMFTVE